MRSLILKLTSFIISSIFSNRDYLIPSKEFRRLTNHLLWPVVMRFFSATIATYSYQLMITKFLCIAIGQGISIFLFHNPIPTYSENFWVCGNLLCLLWLFSNLIPSDCHCLRDFAKKFLTYTHSFPTFTLSIEILDFTSLNL